MDEMFNRRFGKFEIDAQFIRSMDTVLSMLFKLMGKVVIVHAEMMFAKDTIEYTAISPEFDRVPKGCEIPWYDAIHENGEWKFVNR